MDRKVQHTAYCSRPFEVVCATLEREGAGVLVRATGVARGRGDDLVVELDGGLAFFRVNEDVSIIAGPLQRHGGLSASMELAWKAEPRTRLLPSLDAQLLIHPVIPSGPQATTAISVVGRFAPPPSLVRRVEEAMFSRRVLDEMVRTFVRSVSDAVEDAHVGLDCFRASVT